MRNLRSMFVLLTVVVVMLSATGCATSQLSLIKTDDMGSYKGKTTDEITQELGKADRGFKDSSGRQVWEYKRPTPSQSGANRIMAWGSIGNASGSNSMYVDVTRFTFSRGKVVSYTFDENVMNISLPGSNNAQSLPAIIEEYAPKETASPAKSQAPPEDEVKVAPQKFRSEKPSGQISDLKNSRSFPNCQASRVYNQLVSKAPKQGLKIMQKKKTHISLLNSEGMRIEVTLKQVKKSVVVELAATGQFASTQIFEDFSRIYECCQ